MKWIWVVFLVIAPLLFAGACSDDDIAAIVGAPSQELLDLSECAADGFEGAAGIFNALFDVMEAIEAGEDVVDPPEYAEFDCEEDPPEFRAEYDMDEEFPDGVIDVAIWGTADESPGTDLCESGFDVGETFTANWNARIGVGVAAAPATGATPDATGSGAFTIERTGQDTVRVTSQSGSLSGSGCSFAITGMDLTIDVEADGPPDGYIDFSVNSGLLTGRISMSSANNETANVSVIYDGQSWSFDIDLDTFEPIFD